MKDVEITPIQNLKSAASITMYIRNAATNKPRRHNDSAVRSVASLKDRTCLSFRDQPHSAISEALWWVVFCSTTA